MFDIGLSNKTQPVFDFQSYAVHRMLVQYKSYRRRTNHLEINVYKILGILDGINLKLTKK